MIYSRSVLAATGTLIFIFASAANAQAQAIEKRVNYIKQIVAETNRIVEMAEGDDHSSVFVIELNVNRKENPYPAVGIYSSAAKFYYTYGDREKNPYPDRLIKIAVETRRSSTVEETEIFFNGARDVVLYANRAGGGDGWAKSLYFSAGRFIRFERDGKAIRAGDRDTPAILKAAVADKTRLMRIFQASLD